MKRAKILMVIGLIMIVAGAGLWYFQSRQTAKAAEFNKYFYDYNMKGDKACHLAGLEFDDPTGHTPAYVFVGANMWTVTIDLGQDGTNEWEETWTAGDYITGTTANSPNPFEKVHVSTEDVPNTDAKCNITKANALQYGGYVYGVQTAGMYGALVDYYNNYDETSIWSIPRHWHIDGHMF